MAENENERWWFTFGSGVDDLHRNCYVVIEGSWSSARTEMIKRFGGAWCGQYASAEEDRSRRIQLKGDNVMKRERKDDEKTRGDSRAVFFHLDTDPMVHGKSRIVVV